MGVTQLSRTESHCPTDNDVCSYKQSYQPCTRMRFSTRIGLANPSSEESSLTRHGWHSHGSAYVLNWIVVGQPTVVGSTSSQQGGGGWPSYQPLRIFYAGGQGSAGAGSHVSRRVRSRARSR